MKQCFYELRMFRIGSTLLILTSVVPIINAVRIFFILPDFTDSSSITYFFYKMGPFSLGMFGLFLLLNSYFLFKIKNSVLWYVQLVSVTLVGVTDSVGAILFYKFSGYNELVMFLPVAVTLLQWIGLALVKNDIFKKD